MAEDRSKNDRLGGRYMIQDSDHLGDFGQIEGDAKDSHGRQLEQSQGEGHQQGIGADYGSGQQGGERSQKRRSKLL